MTVTFLVGANTRDINDAIRLCSGLIGVNLASRYLMFGMQMHDFDRKKLIQLIALLQKLYKKTRDSKLDEYSHDFERILKRGEYTRQIDDSAEICKIYLETNKDELGDEPILKNGDVLTEDKLRAFVHRETRSNKAKEEIAKTFDYFICHAIEDLPIAQVMHKILERAGLSSYLAHRDNPNGEEWHRNIKHQLDRSKRMIILATKNLESRSKYCHYEIGYADAKEIPVNILSLEPPSTFTEYIRIRQMTQINKETSSKSVEIFIAKLGIGITLTQEEIDSVTEAVGNYYRSGGGTWGSPTKRDFFQNYDDVYKKGKVNVGQVLDMGSHKVRLSDIGIRDDPNRPPPVAIDILDKDEGIMDQMKIYSGEKKPIRGTEFYIEIGEVFPGMSLNAKWADIYILKKITSS